MILRTFNLWGLGLLLLGTATSAAQKLGKTIELSSHKANNVRESGTAFFIDDRGTAVTCYHVIVGATQVDAFPPHRPALSVIVLVPDPVHDLAVIRVLNSGKTSPLIPSSQVSHSLSERQLKLYGVLNGVPDSIVTVRATHDTLVRTGDLRPDGKTIFAETDLDIIPLDGLVYAGESGSPVVDQSGEVIGVLDGSFTEGGTQAWAIPITYLPVSITDRPIDIARYPWPPLQLMALGNWGRLTRSLELGPSFESDTIAITSDLDDYRFLYMQTEEAFSSCRSSTKVLKEIVDLLPEGMELPLQPDSIPDYQRFRERYTDALSESHQRCQEAQSLFKQMYSIQTAAKEHITKVQDDLSSAVRESSIKQLPPALASEAHATMQTVTLNESTAQSLFVAVHTGASQALFRIDSHPTDTTTMKANTRASLEAANLLAGHEVREASRSYLDAMTMYQSLVSDIMAYLSTSK